MFRLAVLCVVLLAVVALQASLGLHPHAPTTADAITLRSEQGCGGSHSVTRTGTEIRVTFQASNCNPPYPYAYQIPLGPLPAGQYRAMVSSNFSGPSESLEFVVRDAAPRVRVRPSVVPVNVANVELELEATQDFSVCDHPNGVVCPPTVIELGGVAVQPLPERRRPSFIAPDFAAGWKDLRVTNSRGTFLFPAAVYYHAVGSEPDVFAFERILFPVLFSSGGAAGSSWRSEAVIFNPTRYPILNANHILPSDCTPYPCAELMPRESRQAFGEGFPHGVALLVPRAEAETVAFSLRVRDVSRDADNLGTEIPVVRESAMLSQPAIGPITGAGPHEVGDRNSDVALLDVPRDPRYRTKVRIYAFRVDPVEVLYHESPGLKIVGTGAQKGQVLQEIGFTLDPTCNRAGCAATPAYAEVDLAAGSEGERVDLFIQLPHGTLGWAFASVTNNTTQQVTIISPNGKGGRPCSEDC